MTRALALLLGFAQMEYSGEVSSLTGGREAELLQTYAFAQARPRMYAPLPLLHIPLSPYTETDDEHPWSDARIQATLAYARYTLGRCGVVPDVGELRRLSRAEMETPSRKHSRGNSGAEFLVYFVHDIPGLSVASADDVPYPLHALHLEDGVPLLTPLPHLIGRTLGLDYGDAPYDLMTDVTTLRSAPVATFGAGVFDPRRFHFTDDECNVMRKGLLRRTSCFPRANGSEARLGGPLAERQAGRRGEAPWPFGPGAPDDVLVSPEPVSTGLLVFALHDGVWRGFSWSHSGTVGWFGDYDGKVDFVRPPRLRPYERFEFRGGLGLAVHRSQEGVTLLTFAEGPAVAATCSWCVGSRNKEPVIRTDTMPCKVYLTSGRIGLAQTPQSLAVVCDDAFWRLRAGRAPERYAMPHPAKWASIEPRCDDDADLWLGTDDGPELFRIPPVGDLEPQALPPWATFPAVAEIPFTAGWGTTPRSLDTVNQRTFDATSSPRWRPVERALPPSDDGLWVRYEDSHGPGWVGYVGGELWVE